MPIHGSGSKEKYFSIFFNADPGFGSGSASNQMDLWIKLILKADKNI